MDTSTSIEFVNLTPHTITVQLDPHRSVHIPPSGQLANLDEWHNQGQPLGPIPVAKTEIGEIMGLPESKPGVIYLVSSVIAREAAGLGRDDILAPDTGPGSAIRDPENGRVKAVKRLRAFIRGN